MAQTVQRRRHQEPAQLSRLAPRPRSLGRPSHSTKLDQKRHRKRAIPTTNAVRALDDIPIFSKRLFAFMALTAVAEKIVASGQRTSRAFKAHGRACPRAMKRSPLANRADQQPTI